MAKKVPRSRKHVPQRTCVGCREVEGKRALIRVVRTPEGRVEVDPTGKRNGRGAYVHAQPECWAEALRGKLEQALKATLSGDDRHALETFAGGLTIDGGG